MLAFLNAARMEDKIENLNFQSRDLCLRVA